MKSLKLAAKGVLGIFASFLICKLFMAFSWMIAACFAAVIMGILIPIFAWSNKLGTGALMVGLFGAIFSGIIPALTTDFRGFGSSKENVVLSDIKKYSFTTVFTLADAHIEKDYKGYAVIMGKRSAVGTVYVYPIVPKNWTPDQEIYAWAVAESEWDKRLDKDCMQGVQMIENEDQRDAVKNAIEGDHFPARPKMKTSNDAVMLRWTCNAKGEWKAELIQGLILPISISIIYAFIVLVTYDENRKEEPKRKKRM